MTESQHMENIDEKPHSEADNGKISRFNLPVSIRAKCSICDGEFEKPAQSRREVCSFRCKEERSRRYSRAYQAEGRRLQAEKRRRFGNCKPTPEEFMAIIKRKDRT